MRPSGRFRTLLLMLTVTCLGLAACSFGEQETNPVTNPSETRVSVAMVTHGQEADPFWAQVKQGAEQAASDFNIDLKYQSPQTTDPQAQAKMIADAAAQKPSALVVSIPNAQVLNPEIKKVSGAEIPVIVTNIGADQLEAVGAVTYVGQDETLAGQQAGAAMAQAGVKRGLCLIHEEQNRALTDRCDGFRGELAKVGGTVTVLHISSTDAPAAQAAVANALTQDPAIDGVLATGIQGYSAAAAAVQGPLAARVKVGTFDVSVSDPNDLEALENGGVQFVVDQQPFLQGYQAVQVAAFEARFGQHPFAPIYTGPSLVTKDNAAKVRQLYEGLAQPGQSEKIAVAMVTHGQAMDPFWALVKAGADQAASDFNIDLTYQSPPATDPQAQAKLITDAAAETPAAMVVTIPDPAVLNEPIKAATTAGTPVVVANVGVDQVEAVGAVTYVGQDETLAGQQAGKAMVDAGVKNALCVIHEAQNRALTDRCEGFAKHLAEAGGTVTVVDVSAADLHGAQQAIEEALKKDAAVDGVLATGIQGFSAAGGALQALGTFGKVKLGTFDISLTNLTAVQNGQALFVVDQQPYLQGYDAVQFAAFQARYGQHPFRPVFTGPSLVTKDNVDKVVELYRNRGTALVQQGGYPQ